MRQYLVFILFIFTSVLFTLDCDHNNPYAPKNTSPVAKFTVSPTIGKISTIFEFDASNSFDNEDSTLYLKVRWDWENDGVWDTFFSHNKLATHQFKSEGSQIVKLEVKDTRNSTSTMVDSLFIVTTHMNYMEFNVGSKWSYSVSFFAGDSYWVMIDGTEEWKVIEVEALSDTSEKIHLRTCFNGTKTQQGSDAAHTSEIKNKINTLTFDINKGTLHFISRLDESMSFLYEIFKNLEIESDKKLSIYQKINDEGIIHIADKSSFSDLDYTLEKGIGFKSIDYQQHNGVILYGIKLKLIDYQINVED